MSKRFIDKIRMLIRKTEEGVSKDLGKLGVNVVQDGILKYRIEITNDLLEKIHNIDEPLEKIKAYDQLVQAAAVPWHRAKNYSIVARMFIAWESLVQLAKWLASYWEEIEYKESHEGKVVKNHLNNAIDIILSRGAKIILDVSFASEDVAPQFIAVLQQQGLMPPIIPGPSPKIQPMYVSQVGESGEVEA